MTLARSWGSSANAISVSQFGHVIGNRIRSIGRLRGKGIEYSYEFYQSENSCGRQRAEWKSGVYVGVSIVASGGRKFGGSSCGRQRLWQNVSLPGLGAIKRQKRQRPRQSSRSPIREWAVPRLAMAARGYFRPQVAFRDIQTATRTASH